MVKARFKALALPELARLGFRLVPDRLGIRFVRACAIGEQQLALEMQYGGTYVAITLFQTLSLSLPLAVAKAVGPGTGITMRSGRCRPMDPYRMPADRPDEPADHCFTVDASGLDDFIAAYLEHLRSVWLPRLDRCAEARGLLQCDRDAGALGAYCEPSYGTLGLAHWAGLADFEELVEVHVARHVPGRGRDRIVRSVAARLKALPEQFGTYPRMGRPERRRLPRCLQTQQGRAPRPWFQARRPHRASPPPKCQPLPPQLPRREIRREPEDTTFGCGQAMKRIAEDAAEKRDYQSPTQMAIWAQTAVETTSMALHGQGRLW